MEKKNINSDICHPRTQEKPLGHENRKQFLVRTQSSKAKELSRDANCQRWSLALRRVEAQFECVEVERAGGIGM